MRKLLLVFHVLFLSLIGISFYAILVPKETTNILSPLGLSTPTPTPKPLLAYTFDNLSVRQYQGSQIKLERELNEKTKDKDGFTSYLFTYYSDGKKVSGLANIPITPMSNKLPVIVMLRGYVDRSIFYTGLGTQHGGEYFAKQGYITLAPDFFGYGESDMPENDVWWERLNNPVEVLNLLASIKTLGIADSNRVGIWAHSNGGQIALSVLEILGQAIPTSLWAPVSKPFPYSILYFTDEFEDQGKALRAEIARFEKDYDVRAYSITDYYDRIKAPLHLHQGTADDAVPQRWSDLLAEQLRENKIDLEYFVYPGADHNMVGGWNEAIARDLEFFNEHLL